MSENNDYSQALETLTAALHNGWQQHDSWKWQWRDRKGLWITMGHGIFGHIRLPDGRVIKVKGAFLGGTGDPGYGWVFLRGYEHYGINSGAYQFSSANAEEIKGAISNEYLLKKGVDVANGEDDVVANSLDADIQDLSKMVFKPMSEEEANNILSSVTQEDTDARIKAQNNSPIARLAPGTESRDPDTIRALIEEVPNTPSADKTPDQLADAAAKKAVELMMHGGTPEISLEDLLKVAEGQSIGMPLDLDDDDFEEEPEEKSYDETPAEEEVPSPDAEPVPAEPEVAPEVTPEVTPEPEVAPEVAPEPEVVTPEPEVAPVTPTAVTPKEKKKKVKPVVIPEDISLDDLGPETPKMDNAELDKIAKPGDYVEDFGGLTPSEEQTRVLSAIASGKNTVVRALAGTGKTTTLVAAAKLLARLRPEDRVLSLQFNKKNQLEAEKRMPKDNSQARTTSSVGYQALTSDQQVRYTMKTKSNTNAWWIIPNKRSDSVAKHLEYGDMPINGTNARPRDVAFIVQRAISAFAYSTDREILPKHFVGPLAEWNARHDVTAPEGGFPFPPELLDAAKKYWNDITNTDKHEWVPNPKNPGKKMIKPGTSGLIQISDAVATKLWALSDPDMKEMKVNGKPVSVIFFDEAQDTNRVVADVIERQTGIQIIHVGDPHQAIYSWRGATNAMPRAEHQAEVVLPLTITRRFGPELTGPGNAALNLLGADERITGAGEGGQIVNDQSLIPDSPSTAHIVRTNAGGLKAIMDYLEQGKSVAVLQSFYDDLKSAVESIKWLTSDFDTRGQQPSEMGDFAGFSSWSQVLEAAKENPKDKVARWVELYQAADNKIEPFQDIVDKIQIDYGDTGPSLEVDESHTGADGSSGVLWSKGDKNVRYEIKGNTLHMYGDNYGLREKFNKGQLFTDELKEIVPNDGGVPGDSNKWKYNSANNNSWDMVIAGDDSRRLAMLQEIISRLPAPEGEKKPADRIITTAHRAKGMEYDHVIIGDDFQEPEKNPETGEITLPDPETLRVNYVALTRAKKSLYTGGLSWITQYEGQNGMKEAESLGVPAPAEDPFLRAQNDTPLGMARKSNKPKVDEPEEKSYDDEEEDGSSPTPDGTDDLEKETSITKELSRAVKSRKSVQAKTLGGREGEYIEDPKTGGASNVKVTASEGDEAGNITLYGVDANGDDWEYEFKAGDSQSVVKVTFLKPGEKAPEPEKKPEPKPTVEVKTRYGKFKARAAELQPGDTLKRDGKFVTVETKERLGGGLGYKITAKDAAGEEYEWYPDTRDLYDIERKDPNAPEPTPEQPKEESKPEPSKMPEAAKLTPVTELERGDLLFTARGELAGIYVGRQDNKNGTHTIGWYDKDKKQMQAVFKNDQGIYSIRPPKKEEAKKEEPTTEVTPVVEPVTPEVAPEPEVAPVAQEVKKAQDLAPGDLLYDEDGNLMGTVVSTTTGMSKKLQELVTEVVYTDKDGNESKAKFRAGELLGPKATEEVTPEVTTEPEETVEPEESSSVEPEAARYIEDEAENAFQSAQDAHGEGNERANYGHAMATTGLRRYLDSTNSEKPSTRSQIKGLNELTNGIDEMLQGLEEYMNGPDGFNTEDAQGYLEELQKNVDKLLTGLGGTKTPLAPFTPRKMSTTSTPSAGPSVVFPPDDGGDIGRTKFTTRDFEDYEISSDKDPDAILRGIRQFYPDAKALGDGGYVVRRFTTTSMAGQYGMTKDGDMRFEMIIRKTPENKWIIGMRLTDLETGFSEELNHYDQKDSFVALAGGVKGRNSIEALLDRIETVPTKPVKATYKGVDGRIWYLSQTGSTGGPLQKKIRTLEQLVEGILQGREQELNAGVENSHTVKKHKIDSFFDAFKNGDEMKARELFAQMIGNIPDTDAARSVAKKVMHDAMNRMYGSNPALPFFLESVDSYIDNKFTTRGIDRIPHVSNDGITPLRLYDTVEYTNNDNETSIVKVQQLIDPNKSGVYTHEDYVYVIGAGDSQWKMVNTNHCRIVPSGTPLTRFKGRYTGEELRWRRLGPEVGRLIKNPGEESKVHQAVREAMDESDNAGVSDNPKARSAYKSLNNQLKALAKAERSEDFDAQKEILGKLSVLLDNMTAGLTEHGKKPTSPDNADALIMVADAKDYVTTQLAYVNRITAPVAPSTGLKNTKGLRRADTFRKGQILFDEEGNQLGKVTDVKFGTHKTEGFKITQYTYTNADGATKKASFKSEDYIGPKTAPKITGAEGQAMKEAVNLTPGDQLIGPNGKPIGEVKSVEENVTTSSVDVSYLDSRTGKLRVKKFKRTNMFENKKRSDLVSVIPAKSKDFEVPDRSVEPKAIRREAPAALKASVTKAVKSIGLTVGGGEAGKIKRVLAPGTETEQPIIPTSFYLKSKSNKVLKPSDDAITARKQVTELGKQVRDEATSRLSDALKERFGVSSIKEVQQKLVDPIDKKLSDLDSAHTKSVAESTVATDSGIREALANADAKQKVADHFGIDAADVSKAQVAKYVAETGDTSVYGTAEKAAVAAKKAAIKKEADLKSARERKRAILEEVSTLRARATKATMEGLGVEFDSVDPWESFEGMKRGSIFYQGIVDAFQYIPKNVLEYMRDHDSNRIFKEMSAAVNRGGFQDRDSLGVSSGKGGLFIGLSSSNMLGNQTNSDLETAYTDTALHELWHWIQSGIPGLIQLEHAFTWDRATKGGTRAPEIGGAYNGVDVSKPYDPKLKDGDYGRAQAEMERSFSGTDMTHNYSMREYTGINGNDDGSMLDASQHYGKFSELATTGMQTLFTAPGEFSDPNGKSVVADMKMPDGTIKRVVFSNASQDPKTGVWSGNASPDGVSKKVQFDNLENVKDAGGRSKAQGVDEDFESFLMGMIMSLSAWNPTTGLGITNATEAQKKDGAK